MMWLLVTHCVLNRSCDLKVPDDVIVWVSMCCDTCMAKTAPNFFLWVCCHVENLSIINQCMLTSLKPHDQAQKHLGFFIFYSLLESYSFILLLGLQFSLIVVKGMDLMPRLKFYAYSSRGRSLSPSRWEACQWIWWQGHLGAHERVTVHSMWLLNHTAPPQWYNVSQSYPRCPKLGTENSSAQDDRSISLKLTQKWYCTFHFCSQLLPAQI